MNTEKDKAVTGARTVERNLSEATIEEQILSDGSKVYNVHIPAQVIYCRNQLRAMEFVTELNEAILFAEGS